MQDDLADLNDVLAWHECQGPACGVQGPPQSGSLNPVEFGIMQCLEQCKYLRGCLSRWWVALMCLGWCHTIRGVKKPGFKSLEDLSSCPVNPCFRGLALQLMPVLVSNIRHLCMYITQTVLWRLPQHSPKRKAAVLVVADVWVLCSVSGNFLDIPIHFFSMCWASSAI